MRCDSERTAAPIDERRAHAGRLRTDAVEDVVGDEEDLVGASTPHQLRRLGIGRDMRLEGVRLGHGDDLVERNLVILFAVSSMSGSPFESTTSLYLVCSRASASGTSGKGFELFDLADEIADLVHRVLDAGALHHVRNRAMTDLPVRRVLAMEQRVDHRVLEMRPSPPGDERIRIALPALLLEVRRRDRRQSGLHVDDRPVLVEHAHLDGVFYCFVAHVTAPSFGCRDSVNERPSVKRICLPLFIL